MQVNDAPVTDFASALRAVASVVFLRSEKYQEQQWRADRVGAHPDILDFERLLIRRMKKLNVPMFAHCVMRTDAAQASAFAVGASNFPAGKGPHRKGCAVDIIHGLKAWDLDKKTWAIIGHVGKEIAAQAGIDVVWGGDWSDPWDPAHWELRNWRDLPMPMVP